jgi:hypothetical protein
MKKRAKVPLVALLVAHVVTGAVSPPALRHVHATPDRTQSAGGHTHKHGHHHHGPHHAHQHSASANDAALMGVASIDAHWHIFWLGFNFTLDEPLSQSGRSELPQNEAVVAVAAVPIETATVVLPESGKWVRLALSTPAAYEVACLRPPSRGTTPAAARPLSDTARHERSGVQLI